MDNENTKENPVNGRRKLNPQNKTGKETIPAANKFSLSLSLDREIGRPKTTPLSRSGNHTPNTSRKKANGAGAAQQGLSTKQEKLLPLRSLNKTTRSNERPSTTRNRRESAEGNAGVTRPIGGEMDETDSTEKVYKALQLFDVCQSPSTSSTHVEASSSRLQPFPAVVNEISFSKAEQLKQSRSSVSTATHTTRTSTCACDDCHHITGRLDRAIAARLPPSSIVLFKSQQRSGYMHTDGLDYQYDMMHENRGTLLILSNETFNKELNLPVRRGTKVDAKNLRSVFEGLRFVVRTKHNQTAFQMLQAIIAVSEENHKNADCVAVAVLSHGSNGVIYGVDMTIEIDQLVDPLKGCRTLLGKPKLFFFQACRGTAVDDGIDQDQGDSEQNEEKYEPPTCRIPIEADFLYAYSTPPGHFTFRNPGQGSWFVQAIKEVFTEFGEYLEINQLMTRVNRMLANKFESNSSNAAYNHKKQVSSIVSMLTKELYFPLM